MFWSVAHLQAQAVEPVETKARIDYEALVLFLNISGQSTPELAAMHRAGLNEFVEDMLRKKQHYRSDKRFLKHLFYKVHRRYLKHYRDNTNLATLLEEGSYDCITGTALYSLLLDALGYKYSIRELPYHVYLMVSLEQGRDSLLLESTDARHGFTGSPARISKRLAQYSEDLKAKEPYQYDYTFEINEQIGLRELAALNYYNVAVQHYNQQQFEEAKVFLIQARHLYPARRMQALQILLRQISEQQVAVAGD
jgi:hypothetical protein